MALPQVETLVPITHKWIAIALTVVLALVIAALTLFPMSFPKTATSGPDKLYRFVAFASLVLPASALYPRALIWLIPSALIFGGAIELIQPFVNRGGEWADYWADIWGVGAGLLFGSTIHYLREIEARRSL